MKPSDLPYAGPAHNDLRQKIAYAIGRARAHGTAYLDELKALFEAASEAVDAAPDVGEPPFIVSAGELYRMSAAGLSDVSTSGNDQLIVNDDEYPWTLASTTGTEPITYSYTWFREDSPLSGLEEIIPGATSNRYTPVLADLGKHVGFEIHATNDYGQDSIFIANSRKVIDPALAPNPVVSGTAQAGSGPGEVDFTLTPGDQIDGHPDTEYEISFMVENTGETRTVLASSGTLIEIPAGTYDVYVNAVTNDITTRYVNVLIASGLVVS